ncbi:MAG: DNA recombination protein RmuC [Rhodospirillaceae bacterium]|nr:DNA recombination protein RmuC [Rhodospirillaceae bacterium]
MEYLEAIVLVVVLVAVTIVVGASFLVRTALARSEGLSQRLSEAQAELSGRLSQLGEAQAASHAHMSRTLEQSLNHHTEKTGKSMSDLHERLAVIDSAQKKITDLSEQVVGLQDILSNKQARGAFGEIQLNDLVASMLPPSAYELQATLSNGKRADCLLKLPNPPGSIVVDAKFPLESYQALRDAADETVKIQATRSFGNDVRKHIKDISEKYIIAGETAEMALMFLPSEAVSAELHANHRGVIEESFKRRVVIVSPTTMWATLNTMRAILKDVSMREQAGLIQTEVMKLLDDVGRLDKRVENLDGHFGQAMKDIREIRISSEKVVKRGERIQDIELGEDVAAEELPGTNDGPRLVPLPGGKE